MADPRALCWVVRFGLRVAWAGVVSSGGLDWVGVDTHRRLFGLDTGL